MKTLLFRKLSVNPNPLQYNCKDMRKKLNFEQINIKDFSIHEDTNLEFHKNQKVTPIIGLNGSGKSILLKILSDIKESTYRPEMIQKFDTISKIGSISFKLNGVIDFKNVDRKTVNKYLLILGIGKSKKKEYKFSNFVKFSVPQKEEIFILPIYDIENIETILSEFNDEKPKDEIYFTLKEMTSITSLALKKEVVDFVKLDLVKAKEIFFSKFDEGISSLIMKTDSKNQKDDTIKLIESILDKIDINWKSKLKNEIDNKQTGIFERGININYSNKLQEEIYKFFNGEKEENDASRKSLIDIFNNITGRRMRDKNEWKPINTKPYINIHLNSTRDDFDVVFGFTEKDEKSNLEAEFQGLSKNDGFKSIYWYIIKTRFLISDIENTILLIDELGNFLNPFVIKSFIDLLLESKHLTIFTSHNPYTINNKTLDSIHACNRNASSPFSSASNIFSNNHLVNFNSKNIKDSAVRIIIDSLSIEQDLFDWRIKKQSTNIYVEGLSDVYAFNKFTSRDKINPLSIKGKSSVYEMQKSTLAYFDNETKIISLVDEDWKRGFEGINSLQPGEKEILDDFILKFNEITSNEFGEIEDIFLKHTPPEIKPAIDRLTKNEPHFTKLSEFKKVNKSNAEKIKTEILRWLVTNNQKNLDQLIEEDGSGKIKLIRDEFRKIIDAIHKHLNNI